MRSMQRARLAALVALPLAANSASAAVIYSFHQIGPTEARGSWPGMDGPAFEVITVGSLILADSIVGSAYSLSADADLLFPGTPPVPPPTGLLDMLFATFNRGTLLMGDLLRFLTPTPAPGLGHYSLALQGTPDSIFPTGSVRYNDSASDARLDFAADGSVTGSYNTDAGGPCSVTGACSFAGLLTATRIPDTQRPIAISEPMSLALFGLGIAGLASVSRRRRALT